MSVERAAQRKRLIDTVDNGAARDARIRGWYADLGHIIVPDRRLLAALRRGPNRVLLQRAPGARRAVQGRV